MVLYLTEEQLAAIMLHVSAHVPNEACGLLGGKRGVVHRVYPVPNVASRPDLTFEMEPEAQVQAMIEIDKLGMELVAIYHSHPPAARTDPSEKDLRENSFPKAFALIVVPDVGTRPASIRAFETRNFRAVEVPIVINSGNASSVA